MKLVNLEEVKKALAFGSWHDEDGYPIEDWSEKMEIIDNLLEGVQEIDAVPVVKCRDCKFNYANQIPSEDACQRCVELPISKDFFCSYGERKGDEN